MTLGQDVLVTSESAPCLLQRVWAEIDYGMTSAMSQNHTLTTLMKHPRK
jgi:hypothetical protein